jgi:hypothetical protein
MANETGLSREAILLLARSAQLGQQLGPSIETIFALRRTGLPIELDTLLKENITRVCNTLEKTIVGSIIPAAI